ncbi:MAG: tRNA (adenosine(37)-N6)-dimethylallyltransferase MiaA [Chloroflexi bacterium]|nr:MAG: tRNA (adenosine(37)-N6)-dimethylallyltransferase MiaA [Chloroflexota bacterium]
MSLRSLAFWREAWLPRCLSRVLTRYNIAALIKETTTKLVVVLGPTASGKSSLGIDLALHFHGEIVSADSRQVYRGLDIGTAKVTAEEQALVPHHLLDVASVEENYTVSQFQRQAIAAINDIAARGRQPFLVGGSPHYIQAVVDNLDIPAIAPQPALRAELEAQPLADLLARLEELDPQSAAVIDRNNPRRVIRALEVCMTSGKPYQPVVGHPVAARRIIPPHRPARR